MSILWCGGEDVDFPNGASIVVNTTSTMYRSSFARCNIAPGYNYAYSNAFPGGAVTSCWFSMQLGIFPENSNGSQRTGVMCAGLGNTSATNGAGIYLYTTSGAGLGIAKFDGSTVTLLASGPNSTIPNVAQCQKVDLQVLNFGTSSIISLWLAGSLQCTFSGSISITGLTNFNCVNLWSTPNGNFGGTSLGSEFIVADEDTRSMSLKTSAPLALGATAAWTGVVGSANPLSVTDSNSIFVNATGMDEQFTQNGLPAGTWAVRMLKTTTRGAASAGATATKFTPGFRLAGAVTLSGGTLHTPSAAFTNFEDFWTNNPVSGVSWSPADVATGNLQLELKSS